MNYECGHCGFKGQCYGALIGDKVSAPWCPQCEKNDKLELEKENKMKHDVDKDIEEVEDN